MFIHSQKTYILLDQTSEFAQIWGLVFEEKEKYEAAPIIMQVVRMEQRDLWNPLIDLLRDRKVQTFLLYEFVVLILIRFILGPTIEGTIWAGVLLILGFFFIWRNIGRFLRKHIEEVITVYVIAIVVLIWYDILDLTLETHRALFQGVIALGLALFVFFQFKLDYENRRRNILYGKQIDALMKFYSIVNEIVRWLDPDNFDAEYRLGSLEKDHLRMAIRRYESFVDLGEPPFVKNILKKYIKGNLNHKYLIPLHYLIDFLKGHLPKIAEITLDSKIVIFYGIPFHKKDSEIKPKFVLEPTHREMTFKKIIDQRELIKREMTLEEIIELMKDFTWGMRIVIDIELEIL